MKKYSSGSFIDAAVRVYGSETDTITSFPASIIANGGNITPWAVYGNTVEGASVGKRTDNLFNEEYPGIEGIVRYISINVGEGKYTLSTSLPYASNGANLFLLSGNVSTGASTATNGVWLNHKVTVESDEGYITIGYRHYTGTISPVEGKTMLNTGETALPYEPYGYKLPVVIGSNTTNIYMADVLRMSSGADPVYDIMNSNGVITRNVATDGTPLVTPTTESFTAPTIATVAGSQSVSFDTIVKPSKAELTYTGWHDHSDKKRSGGAWT